MPRRRRHQCRQCGGMSHDVGLISWGGLCASCADLAVRTANAQVAAKQGAAWDAQQRGQLAWAQRLIDTGTQAAKPD